jgi:hypothetical protein
MAAAAPTTSAANNGSTMSLIPTVGTRLLNDHYPLITSLTH